MDEEITADELHQLTEAGEDVEIVDIRPEPHFRQGHIPGSVNIPFARLPQQVGDLDGAERVVTVCPHGKASIQAARLVRSYEGIPEASQVASLAGGLEDWEYGLESDDSLDAGEKRQHTDDETDGPRSPF